MQSSYANSRNQGSSYSSPFAFLSASNSNFANNTSRGRSTSSSYLEHLESQNPFTLALEQSENDSYYSAPFGNHGYSFPPQRAHISMTHAAPLMPDLSAASRHRRVQPRGGHLEVAGMIVGSWEGNYGTRNERNSSGFYGNSDPNTVTRVLRNPGPRGAVPGIGYQKPEQVHMYNVINRNGWFL